MKPPLVLLAASLATLALSPVTTHAQTQTCRQVQEKSATIGWGVDQSGTVAGGTLGDFAFKPFSSGCGTLKEVHIHFVGALASNVEVGAKNTSSGWSTLNASLNATMNVTIADLTATSSVTATATIPWPPNFLQSVELSGTYSSIDTFDDTPASAWTGTEDLRVPIGMDGALTIVGTPPVTFEYHPVAGLGAHVTVTVEYIYELEAVPPVITVTGTGGTLSGCNPSAATIDAALKATATDNCPNVALTASDVQTKQGCVVTLTRTWTATDLCGNTATADVGVTFTEDHENPVVTATGTAETLPCNPSPGQIDAALGIATAADNCTSPITATPEDHGVTSIGCTRSQTRTWAATDACLNTGTASRTVTWTVDTGVPVITATGTTQTLRCNATEAEVQEALGTATVTDDCRATLSSDHFAQLDGCVAGQSVFWSARDDCGHDAIPVTVVVSWTVDTEGPVITATGTTTTLGCNPAQEAIDAALGRATATDGCGPVTPVPTDGEITSTGCTRTQTRTWTARDACGNPAAPAARTVSWTESPGATITSVTASAPTLWPPNHTMRDVRIDYATSGGCGGSITTVLSVSSNEPVNDTGDGDTDPDWVIVDPHNVQLRSERAGTGSGRAYTITITATDACGTSTATVAVIVAHNITSPNSGNCFKVNSAVNFAGTFWDVPGKRHTSQWTFDNLAATGTVVEPAGLKNGTATGKYTFTSAGVYKVTLNLVDQSGAKSWVNTAGDVEAIAVVYDASAGYTIGGGWFTSPAGAYPAKPDLSGKVSYGFTSSYFKGASNPKGETQFEFKQAGLEFTALNYDYLVVAGAKAQFKGQGRLNSGATCNFTLTVLDGQLKGAGGIDRVRMKIWNKTTGAVIYDTQRGASDAADPTLAVGVGSSIVIVNTSVSAGPSISAGSSISAARKAGDEVEAELSAAPIHPYALSAVRPNPFRGTTDLHYALPERAKVEISVYDVRGARVRTLVNAIEEPGQRSVRFESGQLEAGMYFVHMRATSAAAGTQQFSQVRKVLMLK